jgi:hypothetical protein
MPKFDCPQCHEKDHAQFYPSNPGLCKRCHKAAVYRHRLKQVGLTIEDQARIANEQGNKCAICHKEAKLQGRALHQDHSHATGKPRGLLCGKCNQLLGWARDNPQLLRDAATYLDGHT